MPAKQPQPVEREYIVCPNCLGSKYDANGNPCRWCFSNGGYPVAHDNAVPLPPPPKNRCPHCGKKI